MTREGAILAGAGVFIVFSYLSSVFHFCVVRVFSPWFSHFDICCPSHSNQGLASAFVAFPERLPALKKLIPLCIRRVA